MADVTNEIALDPVTGEMKSFPVGEVPAVPVEVPVVALPKASNVVLRRLYDEDEPSASNTFQGEINWGGRTVQIDYFSDDDYRAYEAGEKAIAAQLGALKEASDPAAALVAINAAQREFYSATVRAKVKGWNGYGVPGEKLEKIFLAEKIRICDLIVQKSRLGRAETDFLAPS